MKNISITYSKDLFPFIHIRHNGLYINKSYAKQIAPDFLKAILHSEGYDDVPDTLIEDIKGFSDLPDQGKDVTVVFTYT